MNYSDPNYERLEHGHVPAEVLRRIEEITTALFDLAQNPIVRVAEEREMPVTQEEAKTYDENLPDDSNVVETINSDLKSIRNQVDEAYDQEAA